MLAARTWWSAALLATAFGGCLFPDYETVPTDGGSAGQLGASGTGAGTDGSGGTGDTGGAGGTGGTDGTGGAGGTGDTGGAGGTAGSDGSSGSGGVETDACPNGVCPQPGKCSEAITLPCDAVRTDKDSAAPGSTSSIGPPLYSCTTAELAGPEYTYRFTGDPNRDVFVQLYGLDRNLDLMLIDTAEGAICDGEHDCTTAGNVFNDARSEALAFVASAGRSYYLVVDGPAPARYSLSIQCSELGGCKPSRAIEAGQTLSASTTLGSAPNVTQNVARYTCFADQRPGPEATFFFTPREAGNYVVRIDNPSANVDLFVLAAPHCNGTCASMNSFSVNNARQSEVVTVMAPAHTSYYIVVDGITAAGVTFDLSVIKLL